ncbi:heme-binding protein [Verrucomicrobiaceae bacterium SCGC AG-212-N21]|nr:heme-binding protein [Verrucomicrobiaceae bacterium SCGC AG-212-N21]
MTRPLHLVALLAVAGLFQLSAQPSNPKQAPKPLKALLIAGGCCHDYAKQHEVLSKGIQSRANVQVDVVWTDDKSVSPPLPLYDNPDWAKGYDIIIHDECAAGVNDAALLQRILDVHKTVPAVHLHCAMHSFRTGSDAWFKHLGIQSNSHGPQEPIEISYVDKDHPVTKTLGDWTTIKEELYNNVNVFDGHPLAMGRQVVKGKDVVSIVAWTNEKQGARSFSTTIGHNNDTVADARYLDLVTRGLLWACDKLSPEYLVPFQGQNKVTFVPGKPPGEPKKAASAASAAAAPPVAPKDATLVTVTASGEESGKGNFAWKAIDGDPNTRWCAASGDKPQWIQFEFDKPQSLTACAIAWESKNNAYQHKVEGSSDGKSWTILADATGNKTGGDSSHTFSAKDLRFLKITCTGTSQGGWASIREVSVKGEGIKALAAKSSPQASTPHPSPESHLSYDKEGNVPPRIVKLTSEQEAAILKDVAVPDGFEVTLFASAAAANYPVFIAADPNGDLYVSSDGNGSLGRNPKRGRIIRLRDLDGDGHADETKVFADVDAPRGLVWDHDRLYVVHPPDLSVLIDKDGDGVAEDRKTLVKGIAFGYDQRPADHTTNGLSLGIDGWLYIAGGDFGFMDAVGTDGKHLQHRGGGVIRVRPDGTGLEIYSTGTRNILEVAISPTMDIFARDNTNDGGGWNVRFHHFTGLDDHGYPRLYKNFNDECIQPLADYGGGSGCGAVYIDEPGFGAWNNAPFTADWGTGALWHHQVKPKGATFEETRKPEPFIKLTRPTDADVDAMSRVYCASWKGATFNWEGPEVGYIVCVKPKGFKAEPLPDFAKASDAELVKLLESSSNRRRMEAQRALLRRPWSAALDGIESLAADGAKSIPSRVAAVHTFAQHAGRDHQLMPSGLQGEGDLYAMEARMRAYHVPFTQNPEKPSRWLVSGGARKSFEPSAEQQLRLSLSQLVGLGFREKEADKPGDGGILRHYKGWAGEDENPLFDHVLANVLARRAEPRFLLDAVAGDSGLSERARRCAFRALAKMHTVDSVSGLTDLLEKTTDSATRKLILSTLCRLHFHEGEWKGDSWGTRPDTRGPYYQPEAWSETPKIAAALKDALSKATPEEAAFLVGELNRNRIQFNEALDRILALAAKDAKLVPDAVGQLASAESIPAAAVPLLIQAAQMPDASPQTLAQAIAALAKTDSADGCRVSLTALVTLGKAQGVNKDQESARIAFLNAPKLENHHQLLELEAEKLGTPTAQWADMALLSLSIRPGGSPESRELSGKALDAGWQDAKRRTQILKAVAQLKHNPYADKVLTALDDPDKAVASAAQNAANAMKLKKKSAVSEPLIGTMKPEDVIAQVLKIKGDVELGEQVFTRATCVACHTTSADQPPKGPYLGNIAQTYKRPELAQNILEPAKTVAQGFATNMFVLKDGSMNMGFVTDESGDKVTLRNIAAQEFTYKKSDIAQRDHIPGSIMPPGLANNLTLEEFASLLDYLESLSKK